MKLTKKPLELLASMLVSVMLSASLTLTLLDSLALGPKPLSVAAVCLGVSLWCALLALGRAPRVVALLLAGVGAFVAFRFYGAADALQSLARELFSAFLQNGAYSVSNPALLSCLLGGLLALASFALSRLPGGVYPALTLSALILLAGWSVDERLTPAYLAPGLVALVMLFAGAHETRGSYWKALPLAVIASVVALALVPAGRVTWAPLENAAIKARQLFDDYFMFTEPRTAYSVAADGYQPQGDALGGPANPRVGSVMFVTTNETLLLRGSVSRTYTGAAWSDSAVNSRYLYLDPTHLSTRSAVFNMDLNDRLPARKVDVHVEFAADGISALFVPGRMTSLSLPLDTVAYYNGAGEVFITRGVTAGDAYDVTCAMIDNGDALRAALSEAAQKEDSGYQSALDNYTSLPTGIESGVISMTRDIIANCETPYDKALALRDYLLRNYEYALDMPYPQSGRDFVSAFLLTEKRGYCTYFASAMAVMARVAGLPSRYVEGYIVRPDERGVTTVTGDDAHAWVEIYFEGAGWLAFDPTPGYETQQTDPNGGDDVPSDQPTPTPPPEGGDAEPTETPGEPGDEPTPTPDPASDPTPDPSDEPTPDPADEPTPTPDPESEPTPTPDPEDSPTPPPESDPTPPPDDPNDPDKPRVWYWIALLVLLLLAIACFAVRRVRNTHPRAVANREKDASLKLMAWYRALLTILSMTGRTCASTESPAAFAARLKDDAAVPPEFADFAAAVEANRYGRRQPNAAAYRAAEIAFRKLYQSLSPLIKARYLARRLLRGAGNYRSVP